MALQGSGSKKGPSQPKDVFYPEDAMNGRSVLYDIQQIRLTDYPITSMSIYHLDRDKPAIQLVPGTLTVSPVDRKMG